MQELLSEHRRIAVFGGVYSNAPALRAMLADARRRDVEAVFCLGDLGGFGPHPDRVYPLLREARVRVMQGNYDASLASGREDCGCGYTDPRDNHFAQISYEYTFRNTSAEHRAWLATLPQPVQAALAERWGDPARSTMVLRDGNEAFFVVPRLQLGHITLLPQPGRGERGDDKEKALYHSSSAVPPHR